MEYDLYGSPGLPAGTFTRDEVISILETEWGGRVPGEWVQHLTTEAMVHKQFDNLGTPGPFFLCYIAVPTTEAHQAWCPMCKEFDIYSRLGQCIIKLACERT